MLERATLLSCCRFLFLIGMTLGLWVCLVSEAGASPQGTKRKLCEAPDVLNPAPAKRVKRCKYLDCAKPVRSRGLCMAHGGGVRCSYEGCERSYNSNLRENENVARIVFRLR
ncbi:MAG: hypothetical protein OXT67_12135, partial [Zetaproteobacteria bacterium]|nr:hypothetical protein [Zetaproteobacteria bacterium]